MYIVKIDQFEGPLDLLLQLIEKEKLDITQLSLAKITDQYLKYLEGFIKIKPEILCDFLVIAAKLLLIKSKYLLPNLQIIQEEDEIDIKDLEEKLLQYKKFKEQAKIFREIEKRGECFYEHPFTFKKCHGFFPPKILITKENLECFFNNVLKKIIVEEKLSQKIIERIFSLQEKISQIQNFLSEKKTITFQKLVKETKEKVEVIVTFLALLELIKQKEVFITQEEIFGEIEMTKISLSTNGYQSIVD